MDETQLDDVAAVASYRSVSVAAIVALVFGLLSPLALVASPMVIIAFAGVFFAFIGLGKIGRSDGTVVGKPIAIAGLALSLCFGTAALASGYLYDSMLAGQARPWADAYITLMRSGRTEAAFELGLPPEQRMPLDVNLKQRYAESTERRDDLEVFLQSPVNGLLVLLEEEDVVEFVGYGQRSSYGTAQTIPVIYRATRKLDGNSRKFMLLMQVRRSSGDLPGDWRIMRQEFEDAE